MKYRSYCHREPLSSNFGPKSRIKEGNLESFKFKDHAYGNGSTFSTSYHILFLKIVPIVCLSLVSDSSHRRPINIDTITIQRLETRKKKDMKIHVSIADFHQSSMTKPETFLSIHLELLKTLMQHLLLKTEQLLSETVRHSCP